MYKVMIDPGHGKQTAGKRSFDGSFLEYEFNLDVARRMEVYLKLAGVEVAFTRSDENDIGLETRVQREHSFKPDLFVSVHANACGTDWNTGNGWEVFCYKTGGKGEALARAIHDESIPYLGLRDRGVKTASFYVIKNTNAPAVLIEHGFYTNREEVEKLKNSDFREKCAIANVRGILKTLGLAFVDKVHPQTSNAMYKVQVGAFRNVDNAEKLKSQLKEKGFDGYIVKEVV